MVAHGHCDSIVGYDHLDGRTRPDPILFDPGGFGTPSGDLVTSHGVGIATRGPKSLVAPQY